MKVLQSIIKKTISRNKAILSLFVGMLSLSCFFSIGATFKDSTFVRQDSFASKVLNIARKSETGFSNFSLKVADATKTSVFLSNFSSLCLTINQRLSGSFSCYDYSFSDGRHAYLKEESQNGTTDNVSLFGLPFYSNSWRFESIPVSLYKNLGKDETAETAGFAENQVVYIPDYKADEIIETSEGKYQTYDDLINSNYTFRYSDDTGLSKRYRIGNIFLVDGFRFCSGDFVDHKMIGKDISGALRGTFGNYIFLIDDSFYYAPNHSVRLQVFTGGSQSKTRTLLETIPGSFPKNTYAFSDFFYVFSGERNAVFGVSGEMIDLFYSGVILYGHINGFFLTLFLVSFCGLTAFGSLLLRSYSPFSLMIFSVGPLLITEEVVEILRNVCSFSCSWGLFSYPSGLFFVFACFLLLIFPAFSRFTKGKGFNHVLS